MLTLSTQIPTAVRGKVRALVKAHKYWAVFLHKNGLVSASVKNADLIKYALYYPELTAQIEAVLGLEPAAATLVANRKLSLRQRALTPGALTSW
jgi:hypothetical protein